MTDALYSEHTMITVKEYSQNIDSRSKRQPRQTVGGETMCHENHSSSHAISLLNTIKDDYHKYEIDPTFLKPSHEKRSITPNYHKWYRSSNNTRQTKI